MATHPNSRNTFDVSAFVTDLSPEWREWALNQAGKLRWKAVSDQYKRGGTLPEPFLSRFRERYPNVVIPQPSVVTGYTGPTDHPRTTQIPQPSGTSRTEDREDEDAEDITNGGLREFTWLTSTWTHTGDGLNVRDNTGRLAPLTAYRGVIIENDITIDPNGEIPTALLTREMLDHWSKLNDLNGTVYYDPERYALGSLASEEYMLIPSNMAIPECPVEHIGGGLTVFQPNMLIISGVYALAKEQAIRLNLPEQDQVKWACIRLEAFKAGWFDRQRYTAYRPMPRNSVSTFVADSDMVMEFLRQAWPLCAFIPFLAEFYFRAYGGSYSRTNAADYVAKAQKLAAGASLSDFMGYLNQDLLYGKALAWIGVRRPMLALENERACQCIPNVFKIRKTAAPAGQAIITTSATIINALRSAHWWEGITRTGNYNDTVLLAVADKIRLSPWKYHIMSFTYGVAALTEAERNEVTAATEQAKMFAPILQAYIDAVSKNSDISRAQALKKHASSNESLYHSALGLFRQAKRQRGKNVAELFANTIFGIPEPQPERNIAN